jgi:hypothetical protein
VPSLDLRFADNKSLVDAVTGASLVTFTRASSGTFVDSAGVIQTAATDVPRFDHNPTTGESLGLLVEEQRTNLLLRSEEFDNASWSKVLATVSANQTTAPDGTSNADKLIGNATLDGHYVQQSISGATSGISYTSSVFAKASELTRFELLHAVGSTLYVQGYDLSNGTLLTRVTAGTTAATGGFIQAVGNGWYRCGITQTSDGTTGAVRCTLRSANTVAFDAASQGVFLWGAQLEAASTPSSYIPTTTAAVTRSASLADLISSAIANNIRTLYLEFRSPASGTRGVVSLNDNTANERASVLTSGTDPRLVVVDGGVEQANVNGGTVTANQRTRVAVRINANDFAMSVNGGAVVTDTSGTLPTVDRLMMGRTQTGEYLNGTLARVTGWTQLLPDSTMQSLAQ